MADKNNLQLPSRNYWKGFKARNEALWDKVKNNTFVNMVFPVKEVSEGNTEAILPMIVPGGNTIATTARTIDKPIKYVLKDLNFPHYFKNVQLIRKLGMPKIKVPIKQAALTQHIKSMSKAIDGVNGGVAIGTPVFPNNKSMIWHMGLSPEKSFRGELSNYLSHYISDANFELGYQYLKKSKTPIIPTANGYIIYKDGSWAEEPVENVLKVTGLKQQGGNMNYIEYCKNGSGIHIKKANRGKFTDYCGGKVTSECIARGKNSPSATIRKRATFAANARKWKHNNGGTLNYLNY